MKTLVRKLALSVAIAASALTIASADEQPGRLGVKIIETSNNSGVSITSVSDDSPATKLIRIKDGQKLTLKAKQHAISHVNGQHLTSTDQFLSAIAQSPRLMTLKVYDYESKDWDEYVVELRGEPTVVAAQPTVVYQQMVQPQTQQYYYEDDSADGDRKSGKKSSSGKKGGLFSAFSTKNYPQGGDWRPGDHVWLGQKKPTDPELRKVYNKVVFAEVLMGVAAGLDAAAEISTYSPTPVYTGGARSHGGSSYNHNAWKADVQMRNQLNKLDFEVDLLRRGIGY